MKEIFEVYLQKEKIKIKKKMVSNKIKTDIIFNMKIINIYLFLLFGNALSYYDRGKAFELDIMLEKKIYRIKNVISGFQMIIKKYCVYALEENFYKEKGITKRLKKKKYNGKSEKNNV